MQFQIPTVFTMLLALSPSVLASPTPIEARQNFLSCLPAPPTAPRATVTQSIKSFCATPNTYVAYSWGELSKGGASGPSAGECESNFLRIVNQCASGDQIAGGVLAVNLRSYNIRIY
ncbi:hypothetical protein P154DRAFT_576478 [Amniculicola lignicola CBS 123094]|uniref:Ecp2 effector protein domain-containing protein n=1 Tax=Amniculicola lignicola CBS 123094 TaxID=1392246 RepID=A0A6A5WDV7_9PLEO|nr:hypothetical protein P154DRAFT_576478 [Amniculicola lignicola CBS 123094]